MNDLGDRNPGDVIDTKFATVDASFNPVSFGGSPTLAVFKANGTTPEAVVPVLTADFAGKTGSHHVRIATASDAAFYAAGNDFVLMMTGGTVDGKVVNGQPIASFSLQNRAPLTTLIDGLSFLKIIRLMAAVLLGKASGLDTTTAVYRAIDDSKDRVTATVTADGNRTAVTRDGT